MNRWPLSVMYSLKSCIFGSTFASSIVNSSLGLNTFIVGRPITKRMYEIAFLCGQPLGDDILITNKQVALQYQILLDWLGVTISDAKSIISDTGAVEFAKKFWVKSMQIDLSPISLRLLLSYRTTLGLCTVSNKYPIGISVLQRLVALSEDVSLDQLMDVPICSTTWRRSTKDLDMIKFGLIWKCYDMGDGWDLTTTPRGNALQSEVLRLREEMFLVDAGLGTPRICMQDKPTGVLNN
ncbi:hypothetical protein FXO37_18064 [Capsicum annuum]|nr:hypothetical protein FXO37_18064 [Capsicum annuum]